MASHFLMALIVIETTSFFTPLWLIGVLFSSLLDLMPATLCLSLELRVREREGVVLHTRADGTRNAEPTPKKITAGTLVTIARGATYLWYEWYHIW